jgi:hypothetical protein
MEKETHAPLIRYFKIFVQSFVLFYPAVMLYKENARMFNPLQIAKSNTTRDYTKPIAVWDSLKMANKVVRGPTAAIAVGMTSFIFLIDTFR